MPTLEHIETEMLADTGSGVAEAARLLGAGQLVAFPTETVYGLGADARNGTAVAAIFEAKGRPSFNPLIVHVADLEMAQELGIFTPLAMKLAKAFWPGPLTLVLTRSPFCLASDLVSAGLSTIAVRMPEGDLATTLLKEAGCPIAAPSANRSGEVSPTEASHVFEDMRGRIAAVLNGGPCRVGLESTVIGFDGDTPVLLRHGGLAREEIERVSGPLALHTEAERPSSPGQLLHHYAPRALVRLDAASPRDGEAFLAFGESPHSDGPLLNLSPDRNLKEAATNLFSFMRQLDSQGAATIAVARIPEDGLGAAINDRLRRAAEPRSDT